MSWLKQAWREHIGEHGRVGGVLLSPILLAAFWLGWLMAHRAAEESAAEHAGTSGRPEVAAIAPDVAGLPEVLRDPNDRPVEGTPSIWLGVLASIAAFYSYLVLLGAALLSVRFWHAGLPVAQAVSVVPFSTLITTALVELFIPGVVIVFAGIIDILSSRQASERHRRTVLLRTLFIFAAISAFFLPFNLYGAGILISTSICLVVAAEIPTRLAVPGVKKRQVVVTATAMVAVAASLPALTRQLIEPLNMERVTITRSGQPRLIADLVAARDTSVVVARCRHLFVLPMPTSIQVESLPGDLAVGEPIMAKLGLDIFPSHRLKRQPMPC